MGRNSRNDGGALTVQVFVRPTVLAESIDRRVAQLQRLEDEGVVEAVLVRAWPDEVPLSSSGASGRASAEVRQSFDRFTAWADRVGASIQPPFDERTRSSMITGESREVLVTPAMCLAIYEDEVLRAVYPHSDEDGHHPVATAIDALTRGRPGTGAVGRERLLEGACPDCGAGVVNVQGLRACHDCSWVAATTGGRSRITARGR